ncbi:MAG: hypothetical protein CW346_06730 [Bacillaceae bacterium]|nr:hypothetical protein [Bacillaceae bacterium]
MPDRPAAGARRYSYQGEIAAGRLVGRSIRNPGIGWNGKQHHTMKGDSARLRFVSQPALDSRSTAGSAENYSSRKGEVLFRLTSISDGKIPSITEDFRRKRKDVPPAWAGIFLPQRSDK